MVLEPAPDSKGENLSETSAGESSVNILTIAQRLDASDILMTVRYVFLSLSLPVTVCNVIVFVQKRMRSATSVYILGLSFAQIFFLLSHIGLIMWSSLHSDPTSSYFFCLYKLYAISFGSVIARRGSYVILCFVSTERLCAILRPLHVKNFVLSKFSVTVMVTTFVVTTVFHFYVPAKFVVTMEAEEDDLGGAPKCRSKVTDLYLRHKDVNDTFSLAVKILMTYMALFLQILLNVLTIWALRRHNVAAAKHVQSSANEDTRRQRERQLTITILVTTIAYVVLSLPACLNGLLNIVLPGYNEQDRYANLAHVVYNLCLDLQILSCSVDFVCFFALSSNYRKTFFRVFYCFGLPAQRIKGAATTNTTESEHTMPVNTTSTE